MARETAYLEAYNNLSDNHGYGSWQMLVLIKAYLLYLEERGVKTEETDAGWLPADYDVAPGITKDGLLNVDIESLESICPDFFEQKDEKKRISKLGVEFFDDNRLLVDAAKGIMAGVSNIRCC